MIIKFTKVMSVPSVQTKLKQISADTGHHFSLLRPMSGGAYVVTVPRLSRKQLHTLLNRLNARKDIEYAVEDKVQKPFSGNHSTLPHVVY